MNTHNFNTIEMDTNLQQMNIIRKAIGGQIGKLIYQTRMRYHIDDLMTKKYSEKKSLVYKPALHLYKDKMLKEPFNERMFIFVLLQLEKSITNVDEYHKIFDHLIQNIHLIESFETISTIFTSAFEIKRIDPDLMIKIAYKGFDLLKNNKDARCRAFSFHSMRFLIGLSGLVGLSKFSNSDYEAIDISKTKPLFLTFILQLFWKEGLQDRYTIVDKIVELLVKQEAIIPYSDMHHMLMSMKFIKDPRFMNLVKRLQDNMKKTVKHGEKQGEDNIQIDEEVLDSCYQDYINDLKLKYY